MHRIESLGNWLNHWEPRNDVGQPKGDSNVAQSVATEQNNPAVNGQDELTFSATAAIRQLDSPLANFPQPSQNTSAPTVGSSSPSAQLPEGVLPGAVSEVMLSSAQLLQQILYGDRWYPQALLASLGALNHDRHNVLKLLTETGSSRRR